MRFCPAKNCGYAGIINIDNNSGHIECDENLTCEKCDLKWKDPLQRKPRNCLQHFVDHFPSF